MELKHRLPPIIYRRQPNAWFPQQLRMVKCLLPQTGATTTLLTPTLAPKSGTSTTHTATEFIVSSPIWVDGKVYLIDKFDLACVDGTTGSAIWSKYTGDELYVSPSYADGKVYMVTSQRHIFVLDVNNHGTIIANATTDSSSWSSPTIANNRLYIGCNDWNVYCFAEKITPNPPAQHPHPNQQLPKHPFTSYFAVISIIAIVAVAAVVTYRRKKAKQKLKLGLLLISLRCCIRRRSSFVPLILLSLLNAHIAALLFQTRWLRAARAMIWL